MFNGSLNLDVFHVEPLFEFLERVVSREKPDPFGHAVLLLFVVLVLFDGDHFGEDKVAVVFEEH
jgi:hypothetical protein